MGLAPPDWASAAYGQSAIGLSAGAGELLEVRPRSVACNIAIPPAHTVQLLECDIATKEAKLKQIWEKEEAERADIRAAWAELQAQVEEYLEKGEMEPCKQMLEDAKAMVAKAKLCLTEANSTYLHDVSQEYRSGLQRRGSTAPPLIDADTPVGADGGEEEQTVEVPSEVEERPSARFLQFLRPVDSAIQLLHLILTDAPVVPLASNVKRSIKTFQGS